jgi:hypothetical protein
MWSRYSWLRMMTKYWSILSVMRLCSFPPYRRDARSSTFRWGLLNVLRCEGTRLFANCWSWFIGAYVDHTKARLTEHSDPVASRSWKSVPGSCCRVEVILHPWNFVQTRHSSIWWRTVENGYLHNPLGRRNETPTCHIRYVYRFWNKKIFAHHEWRWSGPWKTWCFAMPLTRIVRVGECFRFGYRNNSC